MNFEAEWTMDATDGNSGYLACTKTGRENVALPDLQRHGFQACLPLYKNLENTRAGKRWSISAMASSNWSDD